jgi:hypothetical protein
VFPQCVPPFPFPGSRKTARSSIIRPPLIRPPVFPSVAQRGITTTTTAFAQKNHSQPPTNPMQERAIKAESRTNPLPNQPRPPKKGRKKTLAIKHFLIPFFSVSRFLKNTNMISVVP